MLASHAVEVGVTYEPNVSTVLNLEGGRRFHTLLTSREARGMITDVLAVTDATIARNPKLVEGLDARHPRRPGLHAQQSAAGGRDHREGAGESRPPK